MKKYFLFMLLFVLVFFTSCNDTASITEESTNEITTVTTTDTIVLPPPEPRTNDELLELIMDMWNSETVDDLYQYASSDVAELMDRDAFAYLFESISDIGGTLLKREDKGKRNTDGTTVYSMLLEFENIEAEVSISLDDIEICGFVRNVYFKDSFEIKREGNVTERYFILNSGGYKLNAVYTYVNDGKSHPTVILISGSGPSDYNSTVGVLTPLEEIARGLAENDINSIRFDKRTFNYAADMPKDMSIEDEYIIDCKSALAYVKAQDENGGIYLLGHSLGGQIAAKLAEQNDDVSGMILFNSTARHLADISYDQYAAIDPQNEAAYRKYAEAARACNNENAKGYYYYGAADHYWASYNELDTVSSIKKADVPTLIINSTYDRQIFEADIALWNESFTSDELVTVKIYNDMSHFGYKIDTGDTASLYTRAEFPSELIAELSEFCK